MDVWTIGEIDSYGFDKRAYETEDTPFLTLFTMYGADKNSSTYLQAANLLKEHARSAGVSARNFDALLNAHRKDWMKKQSGSAQPVMEVVAQPEVHFTEFGENEPGSVCCGRWQTDGHRVFMIDTHGQVAVACPHPILPLKRLTNVDTGLEKVEIWFKNGKRWKSVIVDNSMIASSMKIVGLSDYGIIVTSETAKLLVSYLKDCKVYGAEQIENVQSVSRLGHIKGYGFSPYCEGLTFDGENAYKRIYESIQPHGDYQIWKEHIAEVRRIRRNEQGEIVDRARLGARLVIDAAFASAILHELGDLSFFVHLWGVESGTGKTVALMCAASVWADPAEGKYIQSFNSTNVGLERYAAFFNNLPMIIDETQLVRRKGGMDLQTKIYELAQGVGRTRGNRNGVDVTSSWKTCFITSGETPITQSNDGAGAMNRVIEIETESGHPIIEDGHKTAEIVRKNYGHAGKEWADLIESDDEEFHTELKLLYDTAFQYLQEQGITGKQAMACAALYATDLMISGYIFNATEQGNYLDPSDLLDYLKTKEDIDINRRAYEFLRGWIASNINKFQGRNGEAALSIETYGRLGNRSTLIISTVYKQVLQDNGYHPGALSKWMKEKGLLVLNPKNGSIAVSKSINGKSINCIEIIDE